jgi:hypothetical protein
VTNGLNVSVVSIGDGVFEVVAVTPFGTREVMFKGTRAACTKAREELLELHRAVVSAPGGLGGALKAGAEKMKEIRSRPDHSRVGLVDDESERTKEQRADDKLRKLLDAVTARATARTKGDVIGGLLDRLMGELTGEPATPEACGDPECYSCDFLGVAKDEGMFSPRLQAATIKVLSAEADASRELKRVKAELAELKARGNASLSAATLIGELSTARGLRAEAIRARDETAKLFDEESAAHRRTSEELVRVRDVASKLRDEREDLASANASLTIERDQARRELDAATQRVRYLEILADDALADRVATPEVVSFAPAVDVELSHVEAKLAAADAKLGSEV